MFTFLKNSSDTNPMRQIHEKISSRRKNQKAYFVVFAILAALIIAACVSTITNIDQPASVNAGEVAHITLGIQWKETNLENTDRQVIGICVPRSWNASQHTTMSLAGDLGNSSMSLIPDGATEPASSLSWKAAFTKKFGIGPNVIDDMEWVVFWTDQKFTVANQVTVNAVISINITTGADNLQFKPGYAMCEDADGLSDGNSGYYTKAFGTCMQVINGEGDIQDFCNPQIGIGDPSSSTDNDLITIKYDGNLDSSALSTMGNIYFCAKAYTTDGQTIDVCSQDNVSKMLSTGSKKWRIDLWPRRYFNVPAGKTLSKIEYFFTDQTGITKTGYGNTASPFVYSFKCK
jgi:hypothetical protein